MAFLKFDIIADGLTDTITKVLSAKATKAEHIVAQQVKKDTEPYVPASTKTMANSTKVAGEKSLNDRTEVEGNLIIYPGPYARYLYYGKVMVDEKGNGPRHFVDQFGNEVIAFPKGAHLHPTDRDLKINTSVHPQAQSHWFEASKAQNMDKWVKAAAKAMEKYGDK